MRIRLKVLALVLSMAVGFIALAALSVITYGKLMSIRRAIDGGVRLITQSMQAHGLMKDVVFDLFSPRVYSSLQGITLAPRSLATRREWSESVARFREAYEDFMGDPALRGLLVDDELRESYAVARPMGERAFAEIAGLDAAFERIREAYPGEEELYTKLQLSKDESLYSMFGQVRAASYYLGDIFESYLNRFVSGLERSAAAAERRMILILMGSGVLLVAAAFAAAQAMTRSILANVALVDRAVERISEGDFSSRVAPFGHDELGRLAERVNLFAARLKKNVDSLTALLGDVNAALPGSPDLDAILSIVTDSLLREGSTECASICVLEGGRARRAWSGFPPFGSGSDSEEPWLRLVEAGGDGSAPVVLRDAGEEPGPFASIGLDREIRSALLVPLPPHRFAAGALFFGRKARPFSDLEIAQLATFSDYAAQVVDNAMLNTALRALSDAEYRALQSQIKPHFLFNVLTGLVALNRMGESSALESSLYALKDMLRYILEHRQMATVAEEFGFLERYCALQKLRFEDRFSYSFELDPGTADLPIPKLIVQPLLENAVIHGVEPCQRPAAARVSSRIVGGSLAIEVEDDGAGCDPSGIVERSGIGIGNVRERLALLYPTSSLELGGAASSGFRARLSIPLPELGEFGETEP